MRRIALLLLLALAAGCTTPREFDPRSRTVSPWSEVPVTLGPGIYYIQLPRGQMATLRVEGCGAMWMDTVSEDHATTVNTLIYGPEPRIGITADTTNGTTLANCVMVSDGSNTQFYLDGCTNTSIVLNEMTRKLQYRLESDTNGYLRLKELPNQGIQPTK
jgi:hypothetical protein